jgi:hypothetical protein
LPGENQRVSLEQIIAATERGLVDRDYRTKWEDFKRGWSLEDRAFWNNLLKRVDRDVYGKFRFRSPLSFEETVWAENMVRRAEGRGLCYLTFTPTKQTVD